MLMTLARLESVETDVLLTVSVPHVLKSGGDEADVGNFEEGDVDLEKGRLGLLVEEGVRVLKDVERGLEIHDWGLFIHDEDEPS